MWTMPAMLAGTVGKKPDGIKTMVIYTVVAAPKKMGCQRMLECFFSVGIANIAHDLHGDGN
jgi:hypothetical protein